jgi:hypothetical protein
MMTNYIYLAAINFVYVFIEHKIMVDGSINTKMSATEIEDIMTKLTELVITEVECEISVVKDILIVQKEKSISDEPSLKLAHYYCIKNKITPQVSGTLIETYMIANDGMVRNKPSDRIGDLCHKNINYELKVSFGGKDRDKFNYVQLRMNHDCSYILTAYYLTMDNIHVFGELFIFKLSKDDMKHMIASYGDYAHGTKKKLGAIAMESINDPKKNNYEYALRIRYGSNKWIQLLNYRVESLTL